MLGGTLSCDVVGHGKEVIWKQPMLRPVAMMKQPLKSPGHRLPAPTQSRRVRSCAWSQTSSATKFMKFPSWAAFLESELHHDRHLRGLFWGLSAGHR